MKTCVRKTDVAIWEPPILREPSPFNYPPIYDQFFHKPPCCPNFKNEKTSLILGGNYACACFDDQSNEPLKY